MFLIPESDDKRERDGQTHIMTASFNMYAQISMNVTVEKCTRLQFPPQSTLEAAHTVHDPGDVEEGQSDVLLTAQNKTHS